VREKLEHRRFLFVSANVVNHPLLSHVHARFGAIHDPKAVRLTAPAIGHARIKALEAMEVRWAAVPAHRRLGLALPRAWLQPCTPTAQSPGRV
jgi:hypothetical protein